MCSIKENQTICPLDYDQYTSGLLATHVLDCMMYDHTLLVPMNQRVLNKSNKEQSKTG